MTKNEFIMELEECLQGEVSNTEYSDSVSFYRDYFNDEMADGKTEEEVARSLGSPRLIAKSIIEAHGIHSEEGSYDDIYGSNEDVLDESAKSTSVFDSVGFQKIKTYAIVAVVLIAVGLVVRVLAPVIIVLLAVLFIYRFLRGDF